MNLASGCRADIHNAKVNWPQHTYRLYQLVNCGAVIRVRVKLLYFLWLWTCNSIWILLCYHWNVIISCACIEFWWWIRILRMTTAPYSCEASWSSAYCQDLRWRIVWQKEAMNLSVRKVAGNLCVNPSTVSKITTLFKTTGDVATKPYPSENWLILDRPGIYLR